MLHILEWLALGIIPWWLYIVASVLAAIAINLYIPTRIGRLLALLAAIAIGDVGFSSKGYHLGAAAVEAKWRGWADQEVARLTGAFREQAEQERARADAAETHQQELQEEVRRAQSLVPPTDASGNPAPPLIVIPPDIARSLRDIGRGPGGSRQDGAPQRAPSASPLRRLLLDDRTGARP